MQFDYEILAARDADRKVNLEKLEAKLSSFVGMATVLRNVLIYLDELRVLANNVDDNGRMLNKELFNRIGGVTDQANKMRMLMFVNSAPNGASYGNVPALVELVESLS